MTAIQELNLANHCEKIGASKVEVYELLNLSVAFYTFPNKYVVIGVKNGERQGKSEINHATYKKYSKQCKDKGMVKTTIKAKYCF